MSHRVMIGKSGDKIATHSGQSAAQMMMPMVGSFIFRAEYLRIPDNLGLSRLFNALCNLFVFWYVFLANVFSSGRFCFVYLFIM